MVKGVLEMEKESEVVSRVEFEKLAGNVSNMADDIKDLKVDVSKLKEDVDGLETSQTRIETELIHIKRSGDRTEVALNKLIDSNTVNKITVMWTVAGLAGGAILTKVIALFM